MTTNVHYNKQNPTRRVMSYHDVNAMLTIKTEPHLREQDQHWELHFCTSLPKHFCERQKPVWPGNNQQWRKKNYSESLTCVT